MTSLKLRTTQCLPSLIFPILILAMLQPPLAAAGSIYPLPSNWTSRCDPSNATGNLTTVFTSSNRFGFGCQPWTSQGAFYITVAFALGSSYQHTPVWAANPDRPVGANASLQLDSEGDVVLRDADGSEIWAADAKGVVGVELTDSGNLIFFNASNSTVWQSFDHPVDLILPGQSMRPGTKLVSGFSSNVTRTGSFSAVMEPDGLAFFVSSTTSPSLPYYAVGFTSDPGGLTEALQGACNHTVLELSRDGSLLSLMQECDESGGIKTPAGPSFDNVTVDFLRLDPDGDVRGYSFVNNERWEIQLDWFASRSCHLPSICGPYGVCSSNVGQSCSCPRNSSSNEGSEHFLPRNNSIPRLGCVAQLSLNCSLGEDSQDFLELEGADYFANDFLTQNLSITTLENCKKSCASNCSCAAAFYRKESQACFHYDQVLSIIQSSNPSYLAFLKVQNVSVPPPRPASGMSPHKVLIVSVGVGSAAVVFCLLFFGLWVFCKSKENFHSIALEQDEHLGTLPGQPIRFTFTELQAATLEFKCKLGVGGFGSVYQGTLPDGSQVAVKQLEGARQEFKEFRAEVVALGNVQHQNLVRLIGFCAEASNRFLVYECMSNGSLDAWIFHRKNEPQVRSLDWNTRFQIAVDIARGLVFLHEQSRERIIHLNIKPQNILLDEKFSAKLSDFGLSKLMDQDENRVITHMRGTPGYMAPEWLLHTAATEKSDVYSFGMVLLEILSGRKNVDLSTDRESWYFPALAATRYKEGRLVEIMEKGLEEEDGENYERARRMMKTAFWCIQEEPNARPSMGKVLLMLEGKEEEEVAEPPLPLQFGNRAPAISQEEQDDGQMQKKNTESSSLQGFNIESSQHWNDDSYLLQIEQQSARFYNLSAQGST